MIILVCFTLSRFLPPLQAIKGGALGIMCAYNMVNGKPACANPALHVTLRQDWGFKGYITSDSDSCT